MNKFLWVFFMSSFCFAQSAKEKAKAYIAEKAFVKAQQEMTAFLSENSDDKEAIELLGDAYGHQEKWDQAIEQYEKLKDKEPNNADYQYKYGGALGMKALSISKLKALGIIGDVKRAFLKAAELDPSHIDARWALVELYVSLPGIVGGSNAKALKYANELQKLSKVDGYLAKGYVYEYDDKPKLAETYFKKASKISKDFKCDASKGYQRNALFYQMGKLSANYNLELERGEKCLNLYIKNHSAKDGVPKAWAYYRLAQIFKHSNNKTQALKWINKAINALPDVKAFQQFKVAI